jgi:D-cysteine desulfhydrase family pyridoxal phosphate-dependent enzyme
MIKPQPRVKLAFLPTPLEHLTRLSNYLGGPEILVKRDDLTGLAGGGNKVRKLEYLLADAQGHGARCLVTTGAVQSNHCRQTAAAAAKTGLDCYLVLAGDPLPQATGNFLLDKILEAKIIHCKQAERDSKLKETFDRLWSDGKRPYLIPYGGSNPIGATAYIEAMAEMKLLDRPVDWIIFPTSSGGTQSGMIIGKVVYGIPSRILGISVDRSGKELRGTITRLISETVDRLGLSSDIGNEEILINDEYIGEGYGIMGPAEIEAVRLFASLEGLLVDPVYTGRAAAGLIDLIRKGRIKKGQRVLFWHTGGLPAIFAQGYPEKLIG